jgi:hypothetical protein
MGAEERGKYLSKLRQLIPTRWPSSPPQSPAHNRAAL